MADLGIRLPTIRTPHLTLPAPIRAVQGWLGDREGRRSRRVSVVGDHVHVEVRGTLDDRHPHVGAALASALQRLDGVQWAEVDAVLGRAVVLIDPGSVEIDDLVDAIEDVEEAHGTAGERFPHHLPDHPDDLEPVQRRAVAIVDG